MKKITLKSLFAFVVFAFALNANAQQRGKMSASGNQSDAPLVLTEENQRFFDENGVVRCATVEMHNQRMQNNASVPSMGQMEDWLAPLVEAKKVQMRADIAAGRTVSAVVNVPIIFHVISGSQGDAPDLNTVYINAQIDQLNLDFNNMAGSTNPVAYSAEINFIPAVVDPNGNQLAEPGIDRVYGYPGQYDSNDFDNTIKPATIWDRSQYANIWTGDLGGGLLGYAQFPSNSTLPGMPANGGSAQTDGVVCLYTSIGSVATPHPNGGVYAAGRTLTHEVGHWLGLRHIWGDANCGDDFCGDTPTQQGASNGCPNTTTCDGQVDQVQNFMDYSYDTCMDLFTFDQVARVITVLEEADGTSDLPDSQTGNASPSIYFAQSTLNEAEGTSCNTRDINVDVEIANAASANATVTFTKSGTATDTVDYEILTPSATFSAGATASQTLTLRIYEDGFVENDETIIVDMNLSTSGDAELATNGTETLTFTIANDDTDATSGGSANFLMDDFESGMGNWTVTGNGTSNFAIGNGTSAASTYWVPDGNTTNFAFVNDDDCNCTMNQERMATTVDFSNVSSASMTFDYFYIDDNSATYDNEAWVQVSTNGGAAWTNVEANELTASAGQSAPWTTYSVDLSAYAGQSNVMVAFLFNDLGNWAYGLGIDNVSIDGLGNAAVQTAVNTGSAEQISVIGAGTGTAFDSSSNDVMMDIQNNDTFDYGCANVSVSRSGNAGTLFPGTTELVTDKVFTVTTDNNARTNSRPGSGDLTNTFYFTAAEIAGWEALPGHDSNAMYIYRVVGGNIEEGVAATKGTFGSDLTLQGSFTSLEGDYYFGRQQILAVGDNQFDVFGVYPNPSNGEVSISLSSNKDVEVSLFDIRGRKVYNNLYNNASDSFNERVDFSAMSTGVYMLEVQSGSKRAIKKLVIQ